MSTLLVVLSALVVLSSTTAPAAAEDKPLSPQAQRMKDCNAQAHERTLTGDARKAFMSDCLKGGGVGRGDRANPGSASPGEAGAASEPAPAGERR